MVVWIILFAIGLVLQYLGLGEVAANCLFADPISATIGAAVLGGGGAVAGSVIQGRATKSAARTQAEAINRGLNAQIQGGADARRFLLNAQPEIENLLRQGFGARESALLQGFDQAEDALQPGVRSFNELADLALDPNSAAFQRSRRTQTRGIENRLNQIGALRSGQQVSELADLEGRLADQRTGLLGQVAGLAPTFAQLPLARGQALSQLRGGLFDTLAGNRGALASNLAQISSDVGRGSASQLNLLGQVQGAGILGQGQAFSGLATNLGNIGQGTIGNLLAIQRQRQNDELLNRVLGLSGGGGGAAGSHGGSIFSAGQNFNLGGFGVS